MTEKRFRAVVCVNDWYIEDKEISPFAVLTPHQSSDLLNKLYNENEHLKKELDQFYLLIGRGDWSGLVDLIKGDVE